jgi:phosphoglycerate dehydrogenase-like enzyme
LYSNVPRLRETCYPHGVRVLTQLGGEASDRIARAVPEATVIVVPGHEDPSPGAHGEALLALPWGTPNLSDVLARGVRWVHVLGTGIDRFPLHLVANDVTVTCSRGGSAVPIAEWVLAVMLAFEKRLPETWIRESPATGWHGAGAVLGGLAGKRLALVGFGAIGQAVATRALAFDVRVRAFRRTAAPSPIAGVEMAGSLASLVEDADHLVLAAPATAATRGMIGGEVLAMVKPGVHLVNVARGSLLDEQALRQALDDGRVATASLDAVEPEPLPAGHWMYAHPRVRLSPHVSWSAPDALDELIDRFIDNLRRRRDGQPLSGMIDRAAGY